MSKFEQALAHVFVIEGEFSNKAADRGGATMFGITQMTYENWRRTKGLPVQPVAKMTREEATAIYREWYWDVGACELLPQALATCAFDAIVNHRPMVAIGLMQRTLGLSGDGVIGPMTQKAYRGATDTPQALWKFVSARLDLYAGIVFEDPSQRAFLKGWLRRAHGLEKLLWPAG